MLCVAHERGTGDVVGAINVNDIVMGSFRSAAIGYWGLGVRLAFDDLGLHRVEANVQPGNARSIALASAGRGSPIS